MSLDTPTPANPMPVTVYGSSGNVLSGVVAGDVAAGATDSGNPVKVGGKYNATLPTLDDGDRGDFQLDIRSILEVQPQLVGTSNGRTPWTNAFTTSDGGTGTGAGAVSLVTFNGGTYDKFRGNVASTGLASAARTASTPTPDQTNYNGRGAKIFLDVTATPNDAQTLTVTVEEKDGVSGKYVQIASFTALVASVLTATPTTETYEYEIGPGIAETVAAAKHELQALQLNRTWRVNVLHSAAGSWTYSVGVVNLV